MSQATIVSIQKNNPGRKGGIYHQINLSDGKRIYCDPENFNYQKFWIHLIEENAIGYKLKKLRNKNDNCYNADAPFPILEEPDVYIKPKVEDTFIDNNFKQLFD
jgi:hypothetical protein